MPTKSNKPNKSSTRAPNRRHQARCLAVQALYQWQLHARPVAELLQTVDECSEHPYSKSYLQQVLQGCVERVNELDQALQPVLDRPLSQLNPVECAILRLAVYEWLACPQVPAKVVLNEAVELAKEFGATDAYKYVNGVLDKLRPKLRPHEQSTTTSD